MNIKLILLVSAFYTVSINAQTIETISTLGCMLEPSQKVAISSPIASVIDDIPVKRGEKIKKGQLLFKLRSGVESANVDLAEEKSLFAMRNVKRNTELFGADLLSTHEIDEIETEMLIAALELRVKKEELAMRSIFSNVNGVVIEKHKNSGEYVSTDPVVEVAVLDPLYVEVLMPFERFKEFATNEELNVILPEPVAATYIAKITIIDPIIDSASGTFRMRLELNNKEYVIPAGVSCKLQKK
jgi:RND family efflux transporter MFP subunit